MMEWSETMKMQINEHLTKWPMKGSEIVAACDNMSDLPEEEKQLFMENVDPDKTYNNREELMEDLKGGMSEAEEME